MGRLLELLKDVPLASDVRAEIALIDREHARLRAEVPILKRDLAAIRQLKPQAHPQRNHLKASDSKAHARIRELEQQVEDLHEKLHRYTAAKQEPEPVQVEVPPVIIKLLETLWGLIEADASELAKQVGVRKKTAQGHLADLRRRDCVAVFKDEETGELRYRLTDPVREWFVRMAFKDLASE
jgi:DNA-binding MarR family transcriptional regulator